MTTPLNFSGSKIPQPLQSFYTVFMRLYNTSCSIDSSDGNKLFCKVMDKILYEQNEARVLEVITYIREHLKSIYNKYRAQIDDLDDIFIKENSILIKIPSKTHQVHLPLTSIYKKANDNQKMMIFGSLYDVFIASIDEEDSKMLQHLVMSARARDSEAAAAAAAANTLAQGQTAANYQSNRVEAVKNGVSQVLNRLPQILQQGGNVTDIFANIVNDQKLRNDLSGFQGAFSNINNPQEAMASMADLFGQLSANPQQFISQESIAALNIKIAPISQGAQSDVAQGDGRLDKNATPKLQIEEKTN